MTRHEPTSLDPALENQATSDFSVKDQSKKDLKKRRQGCRAPLTALRIGPESPNIERPLFDTV